MSSPFPSSSRATPWSLLVKFILSPPGAIPEAGHRVITQIKHANVAVEFGTIVNLSQVRMDGREPEGVREIWKVALVNNTLIIMIMANSVATSQRLVQMFGSRSLQGANCMTSFMYSGVSSPVTSPHESSRRRSYMVISFPTLEETSIIQ